MKEKVIMIIGLIQILFQITGNQNMTHPVIVLQSKRNLDYLIKFFRNLCAFDFHYFTSSVNLLNLYVEYAGWCLDLFGYWP